MYLCMTELPADAACAGSNVQSTLSDLRRHLRRRKKLPRAFHNASRASQPRFVQQNSGQDGAQIDPGGVLEWSWSVLKRHGAALRCLGSVFRAARMHVGGVFDLVRCENRFFKDVLSETTIFGPPKSLQNHLQPFHGVSGSVLEWFGQVMVLLCD